MKTDKEFQEKWNRFCRKLKFLLCCGCDLDDPNLPDIYAPEKIFVTHNRKRGSMSSSCDGAFKNEVFCVADKKDY